MRLSFINTNTKLSFAYTKRYVLLHYFKNLEKWKELKLQNSFEIIITRKSFVLISVF